MHNLLCVLCNHFVVTMGTAVLMTKREVHPSKSSPSPLNYYAFPYAYFPVFSSIHPSVYCSQEWSSDYCYTTCISNEHWHCGQADLDQRSLEESITLDRRKEASCTIIPTIHGSSFCGLRTVYLIHVIMLLYNIKVK
jgi:hypothetical protein